MLRLYTIFIKHCNKSTNRQLNRSPKNCLHSALNYDIILATNITPCRRSN
jgi:hypothetical protein